MHQLTGYDWPGNARQLRNVIERAMIQCESDQITTEDLPLAGRDHDLAALIERTPETNEELKTIKKTIRQQAILLLQLL